MKKIISITLAVTTTIWLSGVAMLAPVSAITIVEGDIVSPDAEYTDADGNAYYPYDVFIIKYMGDKKFKRLVLNPQVFDSYGHLEWANIKTATVAELQAFTTSELTRADGDDKVYKLFPDGDIGTKKWVETLDCFTTNSYDWDSVYIINTTDRDNYTTGAGMCGGGGGDLTFSLASDTPVASSIPYNAQSEPYLKVNVAGSGTISQMVFERVGVGKAADFENVYLYEGNTRLTSGRSVSSSTDKVTFIGLSVSAPTSLTLVADLTDTDDNGHISAFKLGSASDVTSGATVGGTFPITGNSISITSIEGGVLAADKSGSLANPTVGQSQAQVSQFKLTSSYEAVNMERITLYNGGSMNSIEMTNLKLKDIAGTIVATLDAFGSNDLATFLFDTSYNISKGTTKIFKLYADIAGDKDDTIQIYFEVSADIKGIGDSYGHGVRADISLFDASSTAEYHALTLQGGELTIAFNGPIAADVGEDTDDTVLLDLAFTAASNLEIRNLTAYVCFDETGGASDTMALAKTEINDVKIKDKDTGVVLMGPTDGSSFTSLEDTALAVCTEGTYEGEMYKNWTDTWDLDTGETKNIQITIDIDTSATADGYIDADDAFVGLLYGLTNLSNPVKYRGTNDYVADGDIVPSSDITGNAMTVKAPSITVALASVPVSDVGAVRSQTGVTAMGILFTAGDASDMEVTDLVLTAWVNDESAASASAEQGKTTDGLYAKNVVNNVTLYESDGTTKITNGGPKNLSGTATADYDSDVTYDDLSWNVPAGTTKKMIVKVDVTTTTTSGTYDYVYFDIDATDDVTAIDNEGNSSNGTAGINDDADVYVKKSDGGTLAAAAAGSGIRPEKTYVYQGQTSVPFSKFKFTSVDEAFKIDKMTIELDATGDEGNMSKIELSYPIDAAGTLVSSRPSGYFAGTASVAFDLTGKEMYVPKDGYAYVTVYADLSTYEELGDQSADTWSLDFEGDGTTTFHAVGVGSSTVYQANSTGIDDGSGQAMILYRVFPSFALDKTTGGSYPSAAAIDKILEFTITNHGDDDLVFSTASGDLRFDVLGSGGAASEGDAKFTLYKSDGTTIYEDTVTTPGNGTASAQFDTWDVSVTIEAGLSQSFYVKITSGAALWDEQGDWFQLKLLNEANVIKWDDGGETDGSLEGYVADYKNIGIPATGPAWIITW